MPVYVYRREDGSQFETHQSMKDDPLVTCPETGQAVKRVITGGRGVMFSNFDEDFTSKRLSNKRKLMKAVEKNPMHTTMSDKDTHIKESTKKRSEQAQKYAEEKGMKYEQRSISIKDAPKNTAALEHIDKNY